MTDNVLTVEIAIADIGQIRISKKMDDFEKRQDERDDMAQEDKTDER